MTFERAYNSLNQLGGLSELQPNGEFVPIDFSEGSGKVTEVRYEAMATLSRALASNIDIQAAAGGEVTGWTASTTTRMRAASFVRRAAWCSAGARPRIGTSA